MRSRSDVPFGNDHRQLPDELYLLFKYLRPKELERQDIPCFDAWAAVFAQKTSEFEFSVTNEVISKERFRYFIKVPELAMFTTRLTNTARPQTWE